MLVGIETRDDAGIYKLNEETAIIQTVDFFTPMVDDPYVFGQIAATNALNDIYAMGGTPLLALNIVCFPQCLDMQILKLILEGGLSKVRESGALIAGGHTVDDNEPKYGLAVSGLVHPDRIIRNNTALPGDLLFLTKPLGSGVVSTAIKAQMASPDAYNDAVSWMTALNKVAGEVIKQIGVSAATDITGFGLIGHAYEMAFGSDVQLEIYTDRLHFITESREYAAMGLVPGGAYANRDYLVDKIIYERDVAEPVKDMIFSPETAGGLLIAVPEAKADSLLRAMQQSRCLCYMMGRVRRKGFDRIKIN